MTEHNPSHQQESLVSSIVISNQTHDRLTIALRKNSDPEAHVWMTIDLPSGRTESIIVVPPKYGFHISYADPDNSGREIRSNSIRFSQAKLDIAVR